MSEEATPKAKPAQNDTMNTVQVGAVVLVMVLAIFMVRSLNAIKEELKSLNQQVETVAAISGQSGVGNFQLVDADGKIQYVFQAKPMPVMEEGMLGEGIMPEGCPVAPK
ncbi:MAG: hypothetical protein KAI66_10360 [Lentisphaeria bacterium]|nr:hypothetical protein [Lentisphaeria bacterium]